MYAESRSWRCPAKDRTINLLKMFESLNAGKFKPLTIPQMQAIRGGTQTGGDKLFDHIEWDYQNPIRHPDGRVTYPYRSVYKTWTADDTVDNVTCYEGVSMVAGDWHK